MKMKYTKVSNAVRVYRRNNPGNNELRNEIEHRTYSLSDGNDSYMAISKFINIFFNARRNNNDSFLG